MGNDEKGLNQDKGKGKNMGSEGKEGNVPPLTAPLKSSRTTSAPGEERNLPKYTRV